jgi:hypothetical protein
VQEIQIERSDFGIVQEIFCHRCYFSHCDIATARNILDLRFNTGVLTAFALLEAPEAHIRAVDAQCDLVYAARRNLAPLDGRRVTLGCAIVGEVGNTWIRSLRNYPLTCVRLICTAI